jgi:hypothetical protein
MSETHFYLLTLQMAKIFSMWGVWVFSGTIQFRHFVMVARGVTVMFFTGIPAEA